MFYSPLRYPGGKSKLTAYVLETMKLNQLEGTTYIEPFAGGCAIAWYLLMESHVEDIWINDLNESIYSFWFSVLHHTDELCALIENTSITMDEWYHQRELQKIDCTILERGFSTLFLNRTNRSGILTGGVIGGYAQSGEYKLDCRFNKEKLTDKIQLLASKRDQVHLTNMDAVDFIDNILPTVQERALVNIDPPYYVRGKELYQNFFVHEDHVRLYESIKRIRQHWIVTYDNTPEICSIYEEMTPKPFGLTYTAQAKRKGQEVIILKNKMIEAPYKPDISFKDLDKAKRQGQLNF